MRDVNENNKHLSGCFKGTCTINKLSVRTPQPQSILQISTWLTDSLPLWDGQPWIKRTWSLIMHSSVTQPSVATNLDTESSPGLLSALLGIYGFLYRWFTPHSWGDWGWVGAGGGCEVMGRFYWVRAWTWVFLLAGHAFTLERPQNAAVITPASLGPSLVVSEPM